MDNMRKYNKKSDIISNLNVIMTRTQQLISSVLALSNNGPCGGQ